MVIIKDMEMPKCCGKCPLFHFIIDINGDLRFICKIGNMEICGDFENERTDFCPLIEEEKPIIDKIRDEIEEQVIESLSDGGDDWFTAEKVNDCLKIINKYKAESEVE